MKKTRRTALATLVMSLILTISIVASASAATYVAYIHVDPGIESYNYQGWYIVDAPAAYVWGEVTPGVPSQLNITNSNLATWADSFDFGDIGNKAAPSAVAVVAAAAKARLALENTNLYAFGSDNFRGPQVVYGIDQDTFITVTNCLVYSDAKASHGLYTQRNADIGVENSRIYTFGNGLGSSAVATGYDDGGYIRIHGCEVHTWGTNNAAGLYSSAALFSNESKVYAHESEAARIDGGGDLKLDWRPPEEAYSMVVYDSSLISLKSYGLSLAKGPVSDVADDDRSRFAMVGGYLESAKELFYAPNTIGNIVLWNVDTKTNNGIVLTTKWSGTGPGGGVPVESDLTTLPGSRQSDVVLESIGSKLYGDIITDVDEYTRKDSVVTLMMSDWASLEGALNRANLGTVNMIMAKEAVWDVTGPSYVGTIGLPTIYTTHYGSDGRVFYTFTPDVSKIHSNGYTVYYNSFANPSIDPNVSYSLPGGGQLVPEAATGIFGLWRYGD